MRFDKPRASFGLRAHQSFGDCSRRTKFSVVLCVMLHPLLPGSPSASSPYSMALSTYHPWFALVHFDTRLKNTVLLYFIDRKSVV